MFMETGCGTDYGNCKNVGALFRMQRRPWCESGPLQREVAELTFLAAFAREVGASLDPREVMLTAARLLYDYFHYELAFFSLPADFGGVTAFSPLDAADSMNALLAAREIFPDLKLREMIDYRQLGLAAPGQTGMPDNDQAIVEIAESGMMITLFCDEEAEGKASREVLTGIAGSLTTALRNAREHDRVKELSVRDTLTGLYNRRVLEEILSMEESKRTPAPLAVLMIDVDDFKSINDTFGHPAGDRVLSVLGKLLQENSRRENIVARYGGEEFAVLLTNTGLTEAAALRTAERLRNALGAQDFAFSGQKVRLTVSIGVAYNCGKSAVPETMLARADQALYQAKRNGKNRVCLYEAAHGKKMPENRRKTFKLPATIQSGGA